MLEIHFIQNVEVYEKLNEILSRYIPSPFRILRTENDKPYIEGNPLFFSISHSGENALIAISDKPVGADLEGIKTRNYAAVLSRFCEDEKSEIAGGKDFLTHWVVREAYVKMLGATLAEKLKNLKYVNGILYDGDNPAPCEIRVGQNANGVYCICLQ